MVVLEGFRRRLTAAIVVGVVATASAAFACPRSSACPEMRPEVPHSCCDGDRQESPSPAKGSGENCPGDCCRPATDLPASVDLLPPPAAAVAAFLPVPVAAQVQAAGQVEVLLDTGPPGRPVPVYLLHAALLI
jgi:hypothetical protein